MEIAFITPTLKLGGYEKVVIAYANELSRRGNDVTILCGHKIGELLDEVDSEIKILDFNSRARNFIFPLIKYLSSNSVDILYSAFREYNCISVIAKKISRTDVCIYATQHGFQKKSFFYNKVDHIILKKADCLITVADAIADYESKELKIDRNRFVVFNNPVLDCSRIIVEEKHFWFKDKKIPIIAVSGRLAEDKGKIYCLKILKQINKDRQVRMLVLGDGPLLNELKNEAEKIGVSDNVDFLGFVNNPIGYIKKCSVFLHTALVEGFGNVVVEALYAGIPVCVTDCSGPLQIIENGKYGVNLGNVNDRNFVENASKRIEQILDGNLKFNNLSDRALCFEVHKSTDQFLEPYYEYIKKN